MPQLYDSKGKHHLRGRVLFIEGGRRMLFIEGGRRMLFVKGGRRNPFVKRERRTLFIEGGRMLFIKGGRSTWEDAIHQEREDTFCWWREEDAVCWGREEDAVCQERGGHCSSREGGHHSLREGGGYHSLREAVLFDALQISAGMLQFHWIPVDSRAIQWNWSILAGIGPEFNFFWAFIKSYFEIHLHRIYFFFLSYNMVTICIIVCISSVKQLRPYADNLINSLWPSDLNNMSHIWLNTLKG